ncbi:5245_t:CDS:1, partial [Diversispora eburnea]
MSSSSPITTALNLIEVLEKIIYHISNDKNNLSTQHSALLVNRKWCRITTKFIWSAPFSYEIFPKRLCKIIPIYMSFLPPNVIEYLKKNEV